MQSPPVAAENDKTRELPGVPEALVRVPCNLCGADHPIPFLNENGFDVCRCASCSLIYVNPQPRRELGQVVDDFHEDGGEAEAAADRAHGERVYAAELDLISRHVPKPGRLLDVGCGYGFFLERAAQCGWLVHGVDVSRVTVEYARKRLRLGTVERGDLFQVRYPDQHFQAVTLWNCLEHLPRPRETLREVGRILSDGSVVFVRVPNIEFSRRLWSFRWLIRMAGVRDWSYLLTSPPHHLYGFTPRTLRLMLERAGFEVFAVSPAPVKIARYQQISCLGMDHRAGIPGFGRTLESIRDDDRMCAQARARRVGQSIADRAGRRCFGNSGSGH